MSIQLKLLNTVNYLDNVALSIPGETCYIEGSFILNSTEDIIGELSLKDKCKLKNKNIQKINIISNSDNKIIIKIEFLDEINKKQTKNNTTQQKNINTKSIKSKKKLSFWGYFGLFFLWASFFPFILCKRYIKSKEGLMDNKKKYLIYMIGIVLTIIWISVIGAENNSQTNNYNESNKTENTQEYILEESNFNNSEITE